MLYQLLIYALIGIALIFTTYSIIGLFVNNWYDIRAIRRALRHKRHPFSKPFRIRPMVTILIPAFNEEALIERCVISVMKSTYRKYQLVVIDDSSNDATAEIVRRLAQKYPNKDIRVVSKRRNQGKGAALNTGMRYAKGEVILTIDADCTLDRYAIQRAVRYFASPKTQVVTGNVRIHPSDSILGVIQQFEFLAGFRTKKFHHVANSEYIAGGTSTFYRKKIIRKAGGFRSDMQAEDIALTLAIAQLGNKENRIVYANDVLMYTEPVPTYMGLVSQRYRWKIGALQAIFLNRSLVFSRSKKYSKTFSWLRLPFAIWSELMLILEPIAFIYFLYMAVANQSTMLYVGASITLSCILFIHIWGDEYHSIREKMELTVITPALYPLFLIVCSVQLIAVAKVISNYRVVFGKTKIEGTWQSPGRLAELKPIK